MTELERHKEALEKIANATKAYDNPAQRICDAYNFAQEALNPPVEYGEVPIECYRWFYKPKGLVVEDSIQADFSNHPDYERVKLTGTYRRPVKPKVKRREEMKPVTNQTSVTIQFMAGHRYFDEWEE